MLGGNAAGCGVAEDVEAFGVGLHQPVLDAVVHHLHEVAGAFRSAMETPEFGRASAGPAWRRRRGARPRGERPEDRLEPRDLFSGTADHEAVAAIDAPDATARADVHVVNLSTPQLARPSHV